MLQCWEAFDEVLRKTVENYGIHIHCFVLMSNHLHLGVTTPYGNLDAAMRYLLTEVNRRIRKISGRINHIFGGRYKRSVVTDPVHWAYVYKYIHRNPVKAGICERAEQYPYSTLRKSIHHQSTIPIVEGIG